MIKSHPDKCIRIDATIHKLARKTAMDKDITLKTFVEIALLLYINRLKDTVMYVPQDQK